MRPDTLQDHAAAIRRLARSLVYDNHLGEDIAQDALVVGLTAPPRDPSRPRAWLAGVTRNLARTARRTTARRRTREAAAARPERVPSVSVTSERLEEHQLVVDAMQSLSEPLRTAVYMRYFEGLPPRDIAARLEVPVGTIKTRLNRGLNALREDLDKRHGGDRSTWLSALAPLAGPRPSAMGAGAMLSMALMAGLLVVGGVIMLFAGGAERNESRGGSETIPRDESRDDESAQLVGRGSATSPGLQRDVDRAPPSPAPSLGTIIAHLEPIDVSVSKAEINARRGSEHLRKTVAAGEACRLDGLKGGEWAVWVEAPGTASISRVVRLSPGSEQEIWLRLIPAKPLVGRVVDRQTGRGVVGARVNLVADSRRWMSPQWTATTGATGAFRIDRAPEPAYWNGALHVSALAAGYAAAEVEITSTEDSTEIRLEPGGVVSGQVAYATGEVVPSATVWLIPYLDGRDPLGLSDTPALTPHLGTRHGQHWYFEGEVGTVAWEQPLVTRADAEGRFRLEFVLPDHRYWLVATINGSKDRSEFEDIFLVAAGAELKRTVIYENRPAKVALRIVDEKGNPIPRAKVEGHVSDAEGWARFDLRKERYWFQVTAPGFAPVRVEFDASPDLPVVQDVVLKRGRLAIGTVVTSEGVAVAHARVLGDVRGESVYPDRDGRVNLYARVEEPTRIVVSATGYEAASHELGVDSSSFEVRMAPAVKAKARVRLVAPEGHTLPSTIHVDRATAGESEWLLRDVRWRADARGWSRGSARSLDDEGVLVLSSEFPVGARIWAPGFLPIVVSAVALRSDDTFTELEPAGSLAARLLDAQGEPIEGALVWWDAQFLWSDFSAETDREGAFQISCCPNHTREIQVFVPGVGRRTASTTDDDAHVFQVGSFAAVRGTVRMKDGGPVAIWTEVRILRRLPRGDMVLYDLASTDGRGRFGARLPAGDYELHVVRGGDLSPREIRPEGAVQALVIDEMLAPQVVDIRVP